MNLIKKYLSAQTLKLLALIGLLIISAGLLIFLSYINNKDKNLSLKNSKAAEPVPTYACDVRFSVLEPTPTYTPTPTFTITPTITITPTLNCKDLDIGIVVDRSSTMNELETDGRTKLAWAKEAISVFANKLAQHTDASSSVRVSVTSFGRRGNADDPILGNLTYPSPDANEYNSILHTTLSSNITGVVIPAINNVSYIKSGTCIQCGLYISNNQFTNNTNRKVVILLSDGIANKVWTGDNPLSTVCKQAAVDQANSGRAKGIEYKVLGYGVPTGVEGIDETVLKRIACADPNDTNCVSTNYSYKPNPTDWTNGFLEILNDLCR